jgi:hypothetical protein
MNKQELIDFLIEYAKKSKPTFYSISELEAFHNDFVDHYLSTHPVTVPTDAVEFAEWIHINGWRAFADDGTTWLQYSYNGGEAVSIGDIITTAELYEQYKSSINNK